MQENLDTMAEQLQEIIEGSVVEDQSPQNLEVVAEFFGDIANDTFVLSSEVGLSTRTVCSIYSTGNILVHAKSSIFANINSS